MGNFKISKLPRNDMQCQTELSFASKTIINVDLNVTFESSYLLLSSLNMSENRRKIEHNSIEFSQKVPNPFSRGKARAPECDEIRSNSRSESNRSRKYSGGSSDDRKTKQRDSDKKDHDLRNYIYGKRKRSSDHSSVDNARKMRKHRSRSHDRKSNSSDRHLQKRSDYQPKKIYDRRLTLPAYSIDSHEDKYRKNTKRDIFLDSSSSNGNVRVDVVNDDFLIDQYAGKSNSEIKMIIDERLKMLRSSNFDVTIHKNKKPDQMKKDLTENKSHSITITKISNATRDKCVDKTSHKKQTENVIMENQTTVTKIDQPSKDTSIKPSNKLNTKPLNLLILEMESQQQQSTFNNEIELIPCKSLSNNVPPKTNVEIINSNLSIESSKSKDKHEFTNTVTSVDISDSKVTSTILQPVEKIIIPTHKQNTKTLSTTNTVVTPIQIKPLEKKTIPNVVETTSCLSTNLKLSPGNVSSSTITSVENSINIVDAASIAETKKPENINHASLNKKPSTVLGTISCCEENKTVSLAETVFATNAKLSHGQEQDKIMLRSRSINKLNENQTATTKDKLTMNKIPSEAPPILPDNLHQQSDNQNCKNSPIKSYVEDKVSETDTTDDPANSFFKDFDLSNVSSQMDPLSPTKNSEKLIEKPLTCLQTSDNFSSTQNVSSSTDAKQEKNIREIRNHSDSGCDDIAKIQEYLRDFEVEGESPVKSIVGRSMLENVSSSKKNNSNSLEPLDANATENREIKNCNQKPVTSFENILVREQQSDNKAVIISQPTQNSNLCETPPGCVAVSNSSCMDIDDELTNKTTHNSKQEADSINKLFNKIETPTTNVDNNNESLINLLNESPSKTLKCGRSSYLVEQVNEEEIVIRINRKRKRRKH